jgi:hypothetical protein
LAKVRGEWALVCLTHNILKLHRLCMRNRHPGGHEKMPQQNAHLFLVASRPAGASQDPWPVRIINSYRSNPKINSTGDVSRTRS